MAARFPTKTPLTAVAFGIFRQVAPLSREIKIAFPDIVVGCGRCGALTLDRFGLVLFGFG